MNTLTANHNDANQAAGQRDEKGHFCKGNRGGPGNPFARQSARLRQVALDAVSDDDIHGILNAMKEKARQGDVAAGKLVLSYSVGKPLDMPSPDALDQDEMQVLLANHAVTADSIVRIIHGMPLELLLEALRAALPALLESKRQMAATILAQPLEEVSEDEEEAETEQVAEPQPQEVPEWLREVAAGHAPSVPVTNAPPSLTDDSAAESAGTSAGAAAELLRRLLGRLQQAAPTQTVQTAPPGVREAAGRQRVPAASSAAEGHQPALK